MISLLHLMRRKTTTEMALQGIKHVSNDKLTFHADVLHSSSV